MRHALFAASDAKKIYASPRLPNRGYTTSSAIGAATSDGRSTLPTLGMQPNARGQSPNVAKRTSWTTPRSSNNSDQAPDTLAEAEADYEDVEEYAASIKTFQKEQPAVDPASSSANPMENALEILEAVARENEQRSEVVHHRSQLLQQAHKQHASEMKEHETQQLAYLEHMYATIQLLQADLEKERRRSSGASNTTELVTLMSEPALGHGSSGSHTATLAKSTRRSDMPAKLLQSPLRARLGNGPTAAQESARADLQSALGRNADMHIRARLTEKSALEREQKEYGLAQKEALSFDKPISMREQKLRETLSDKVFWQHEYEAMRDQVVEEKTRQVELFRRLEKAKRDHLLRTEELERALHECCVEIGLLTSQVAETRMCVVHQKRTMEDLTKHAKEEKEKLVCSIAETRHKFKEWKEGEAGTLKAARDQAVHNLKTEYELKIARHHEEKQKLRDKVKDLEVSLRLLQKDRNLSPVELSLRKATILGSKEGGSTTEAELIEANCRIRELEALLNHAKEYQKRQEQIIRVSESTISRLMQEREVVALENLTLQPMTGLASLPLSLVKVVDPIDSAALPKERHSIVSHDPLLGSAPQTPAPKLAADHSADGNATSAGPSFASTLVHAHSTLKRKSSDISNPKRRPSGANPKYGQSVEAGLHQMGSSSATLGSPSRASDPEKEILRRQSIVLSAEVEKYRQIVVHSLDEIRTLKDNRRRSHHGMLLGGQNGNAASLKEQYLMSEVLKMQAELEAMKVAQKKKDRLNKKRRGENGGKRVSENDDESSSSSSSDSDDDSSGSEHGKDTQAARAATDGSDVREDAEEMEDKAVGENEIASVTTPLSGKAELLTHAGSSSFEPSTFDGLTPLDSPFPETETEVGTESGAETVQEMEVAVKVIQGKSKAFLLRRDFIKKRIAIGKIKARYRGYLVRKNVELLDRHHQKPFIVSQAMQYKMEIVSSHHDMTSKCHGLNFKLVIRVSKDPPIVQIQMSSVEEPVSRSSDPLSRFDAPMHEDFQGVQTVYFHLFEIIALLPLEEESIILEKSSEMEIAETFASLLSVVRVAGQYKVSIRRKRDSVMDHHDHRVQFSFLPSNPSGSILTELPVERIPERAAGWHSKGDEGKQIDAVDDAKELEDLIRKARVPNADGTVQLDFDDIESNISSRADHVHLKKMLRRMSTKSLDNIPESPRSTALTFK